MSVERTKKFAEILNSYGIPTYGLLGASSMGSAAFMIAKKTQSQLKLWVPEHVDITIRKKGKLCLLKVKEKTRKVKAKLSSVYLVPEEISQLKDDIKKQLEDRQPHRINFTIEEITSLFTKYNTRRILDKIKISTNTNVTGVFSKVELMVPIQKLEEDSYRIGGYCKGKCVITARSATHTFLVGIDETNPFISQLKTNKSTNVDEAIEELRPKGIKKNAKRQGEWFFNPISIKKNKELLARIDNASRKEPLEGKYVNPSSHRAALLIKEGGKKYVLGTIRDVRANNHKDLVLTDFHEVVRNNEKNVSKVTNVVFD